MIETVYLLSAARYHKAKRLLIDSTLSCVYADALSRLHRSMFGDTSAGRQSSFFLCHMEYTIAIIHMSGIC